MPGKLDSRELSGIRWLLGQLLVLVSIVGSYAVDLGSGHLVSTVALLVIVASLAPRWTRLIPAAAWKIAPVVLLLVILGDFILSGGDILPPLFRMILWLTLYRAIQPRRTREDLQLILLTLFLMLITGVLSLEITFGLQMLLYAPLAMGLLIVVNLSSSREDGGTGEEDELTYSHDGWPSLFRRMLERIDRRTFLAGMSLFILTTGMALVMFVLLPRFDIGAALPFPRLQTTQSLTGFTDRVEYGDVVSILNDDSIAMRVDVDLPSPPSQPYWRMVVLDAYYDGGFMVSPKVARERRILTHHRFDFDDLALQGKPGDGTWTLYLEGGISAYIPTGDAFNTLRFNNRIDLQIHDLTGVLKTNETNATTLTFRYEGLGFDGQIPSSVEDRQLIGMRPQARDTSQSDYLKDTGYPDTLMVYPEGEENIRILQDALEAIGPVEGLPAGDFARLATGYLREGREYSLRSSIPSGRAERLLRWLDSSEPGHCELYAGSFVLLSRYAGYPARLVTGFAGGDWNGFENYFMVRNRHAHAWCEIFDPEQGWLRVDPTSGLGARSLPVDLALAGGTLLLDRTWQAYLDSLRVLWFRRVVQFDGGDQQAMAESVKGVGATAVDWVKGKLLNWRTSLRRDWDALVNEGQWQHISKDVGYPAVAILSIAVLILLIQRNWRSHAREKAMRLRAGAVLGRISHRLPDESPGRACLLGIRYGPVASWPEKPGRRMREIRRHPDRFAQPGRDA